MLPGEIIKAKLYQCWICAKEDRIFAFDWYGGYESVQQRCICHSCKLKIINRSIFQLDQERGG